MLGSPSAGQAPGSNPSAISQPGAGTPRLTQFFRLSTDHRVPAAPDPALAHAGNPVFRGLAELRAHGGRGAGEAGGVAAQAGQVVQHEHLAVAGGSGPDADDGSTCGGDDAFG